jgi:hypothetical protein
MKPTNESKLTIFELSIGFAMSIGNDKGIPDVARATNLMKQARALNTLIEYDKEDEQAPAPKIVNEERRKLETQALLEIEDETTLHLRHLRAMRLKHGMPSASERIQAKALGVKSSSSLVTYASVNRASLLDDDSPHLGKIAATIVKRINYPKALCGKQSLYKVDSKLGKAGEATKAERAKSTSAKVRRLLSPEEECEVFQTCALVLVSKGKLHAEKLTLEDWKELFRASRKALGIDRMQGTELATDPTSEVFSLLEQANGFDAESIAIARQRLAKRFKYWYACLKKSLQVSSKRERKANFKRQRFTLRKFAAGNFRVSNMSQAELQQASKSQAKLFKSIAEGEAAFDTEAELESRALECLSLAKAMQASLV